MEKVAINQTFRVVRDSRQDCVCGVCSCGCAPCGGVRGVSLSGATLLESCPAHAQAGMDYSEGEN